MDFEKGKSDFCLRYAGTPTEAIEHFNQSIDSHYRVKGLDEQQYQADIRRHGFFNYLFRHMYPQMVYHAEALSEHESRVYVNFEMPLRIRVMCHLGIIFSFALLHFFCLSSCYVTCQAITLLIIGTLGVVYAGFFYTLVGRVFSKRLDRLLHKSGYTKTLWYEKNRKAVDGIEYIVTQLLGLISLVLKMEWSGLHDPYNQKILLFFLFAVPGFAWGIRVAHLSYHKDIMAQRYCGVIGAIAISFVFILLSHCPDMVGGSLVGCSDSQYLLKSNMAEVKFNVQHKIVSEQVYIQGALLQCFLIWITEAFIYTIALALLVNDYFYVEQFCDEPISSHLEEVVHIFDQNIQKVGDRYSYKLLEGKLVDKIMIIYVFVLLMVFMWRGFLTHIDFLINAVQMASVSVNSDTDILLKIIQMVAGILANGNSFREILIQVILIASVSLTFVGFGVMWLHWLLTSLKQWFRSNGYQSLWYDDRLPLDPKLEQFLKQEHIELVLDPHYDKISPYARFELLSRRKRIFLSEWTLVFFARYPKYISAVLTHEVGHFVKGHCLKIQIAEFISRVGFVSPGMLSLLFNYLKNEEEADDYAKPILKEMGLDSGLIKQAAYTIKTEEARRRPDSKLRPAAFASAASKADSESSKPVKESKWLGTLKKVIHTFYTFQFELTLYDYLHPPEKYR